MHHITKASVVDHLLPPIAAKSVCSAVVHSYANAAVKQSLIDIDATHAVCIQRLQIKMQLWMTQKYNLASVGCSSAVWC